MPQGDTRAAPLLSSSSLRRRAKDKADVELIDLGGDALERKRGGVQGREGGKPTQRPQGWASVLKTAGPP